MHNIKSVSLLLERFGLDTSYYVYLDVYATSISGEPYGIPLITIQKKASDISNLNYYNFVFEETLSTPYDHLSFILRKDDTDDDNFIIWGHSNVDDSNIDVYGYALDNLTIPTDPDYLGDYELYGFGYGFSFDSGYNYFDIFGILGNLQGYSTSLISSWYGFEHTSLSRNNNFSRCIKIYDEFNNIVFDNGNGYYIEIPGGESNYKLINNKQDFIDSYKNNIDILGDRITVKGIGRRLGFIDFINNTDGKIIECNNGLPPSVLCFDITSGADEFNCIAFIGTELDGLYKSNNSGSSWSKVESFAGNNITSLRISPNSSVYAVASYSPSSRLYISEDGTTWSYVSVLNNAKIIDMVWQGNNVIYLSTEEDGVLKYVLDLNSISYFNNGLSSIPTGRKLHLDYNLNIPSSYSYGFGFGGGFGINYFDVFNTVGSLVGYGAGSFEEYFNNTFGYGYGFEYVSYRKLYWATDQGLYLNDLNFGWFLIGQDYGISDCYSVYAKDNSIYVGLNDGLALSIDGGNSFYKNNVQDDVKIKGLIKNPVINIIKDNVNGILYTGQNGSLSYSYSVSFKELINTNNYDTDIIDISINPLNPYYIYILTRSEIKFNKYFSYIIDNSSSVNYLDVNNAIKDLIADLSYDIYNVNNDTRFQVIQFQGTNNTSSISGSNSYRPEAINLTSGFIINDSSNIITEYLDDIQSHGIVDTEFTTPLIDSLHVSLTGIISGGANWTYNSSSMSYNIDKIKDDNLLFSKHSILLITDGNDTNSVRTISNLINDVSLKNKLNIVFYILVIGNDYNKYNLYSLKSLYKNTHIIICNDISEISQPKSYILNLEQDDESNGLFRKIFLLDDVFSEVNEIEIDTKIPNGNDVFLSYRFHDNNYDLMDISFTDNITLSDGNNKIPVPNIQCLFFEIQLKFSKKTFDKFPFVSSIKINYKTPKSSKIVFKQKDYNTSRIGQVLLTRNMFINNESNVNFISNYGSGINDIFKYGPGFGLEKINNENLSKIKDDWYLSHSNSWSELNSDNIRKEKTTYTNRRINEKCSTNDYYLYSTTYGSWDKNLNTTVYKNGIIQNEKNYDTYPSEGIVRFHKQLYEQDFITIDIEPSLSRRTFLILKNTYNELNVLFKDYGLMFLPEDETKTTREAIIPAFSSQFTTDNPITLDIYNIKGYNNIKIKESYIPIKSNISYFNALSSIPLNNYLLFTFGDIYTYLGPDLSPNGNYELMPHQKTWIFDDFKSIGSSYNVIYPTTNQSTLFLFSNMTDLNYYGNKYATFRILNQPLNSSNVLTINIGDTSRTDEGFNFEIKNINDTDHLINSGGGAIQTYVWSGFNNNLTNCDKHIDYSDKPIKSSLEISQIKIRVNNDVITNSPEIIISLQTIDSNGRKYEEFEGFVEIGIIHYNFESDTTSYSDQDNQTLKFDKSNYGEINKTVSLYPGISYIYAKIIGTIDIYVGPPIKYSTTPSQNFIYFGDLNVRSAVSTGRQSPDFIYKYARDISKLDFCAVSDNLDSIGPYKFVQIDRKANFYNVNGQFVTFPSFRFISYNISNELKNEGIRTFIFKTDIYNISSMRQNSNGVRPQITSYNDLYSRIINSDFISILQSTAYRKNSSIGDKYNYNFASEPTSINSTYLSTDRCLEIYSEQGHIENELIDNTLGLVDRQLNNSNHSYFVGSINFGKKLSIISNSNSDISRPGLYNGELTRQSSFPSNNNRGITGVWSADLTRENIFDSIKQGRTFGTTGNKCYLDFSANVGGNVFYMGYKGSSTVSRNLLLNSVVLTLEFYSNVNSSYYIYRYGNFISNDSVPILVTSGSINIAEPKLYNFSDNIVDATLTSDQQLSVINNLPNTLVYYVKVVQSDKHICWGSPIYINLA